jgi:hypothetical protein
MKSQRKKSVCRSCLPLSSEPRSISRRPSASDARGIYLVPNGRAPRARRTTLEAHSEKKKNKKKPETTPISQAKKVPRPARPFGDVISVIASNSERNEKSEESESV